MEPVRIKDTDTYVEMAQKIFMYFELNQSCAIRGFIVEGDCSTPRGDMVLDVLERLDSSQNTYKEPGRKNRRKRKVLPESIGGWVAQKIFRYKKETTEGEYKVTIWRVQ